MSARLLALLAFLLATPAAHAEQPLDLGALVAAQCKPAGYFPEGGCRITLGPGTFALARTAQLGTCTTTTLRNGLLIEGVSAGAMTVVPRYTTAGTTLRWAGTPGQTMIEVCGSRIELRDLTLDGRGAGTCVRWTADNTKSAISHFGGLRDVELDGCATGIEVTGPNRNDQADFLTFARVGIRDVSTCYVQDSQQTVAHALDTIDCAAKKAGYVIRGGALHCTRCYVGNLGADPAFVGFHLTKSSVVDGRNFARWVVSIRDSHFELRSGRFVVEDAGSSAGILLEGNTYSLQCATPGCEMLVLDSASKGNVTMIGETFTASSSPFAYPKARACQRGSIARFGNTITGTISAFTWGCAP